MNLVLDTNAVIYLQKGSLAEPLPVGCYFLSVITEIELLSNDAKLATVEGLRCRPLALRPN